MKEKHKSKVPRTIRASINVALVFILMVGMSGCMFRSSEETVAPKMLEYMKEKYGEEFTLSDNNFMQVNFAGTPTSLLMYSESHPEWIVTVNYTPGEPFSDNYVGFLKMDEVHDYLKPYFDEIYGPECRLFVDEPTSLPLPSDFNRDTNVETFLSRAPITVVIYVNSPFETSDDDVGKIWTSEGLSICSMSIRIYYFSQEAFNTEAAQKKNDALNLPYLYRGDLVMPRSRANFYGVAWNENDSGSASTS